MRNFKLLGLLIFPLLAAPAAASDAPQPRPVVHDEVTRAWDEFTRQLHDWGSYWRDHFGSGLREPPGERPLISIILSHRDELNLTSDQVRNLERVRNDFEREAIKHRADIRVAEMDLSALLEADSVDLKKAEAKVREIERLQADMRFARIRAIEQGKGLLSQEQREKLRSMLGGTNYTRRPDRQIY